MKRSRIIADNKKDEGSSKKKKVFKVEQKSSENNLRLYLKSTSSSNNSDDEPTEEYDETEVVEDLVTKIKQKLQDKDQEGRSPGQATKKKISYLSKCLRYQNKLNNYVLYNSERSLPYYNST